MPTTCHMECCEQVKDRAQVFCWHHWKMVPNKKRKALVRAFKRREEDSRHAALWGNALEAMRKLIADKERRA